MWADRLGQQLGRPTRSVAGWLVSRFLTWHNGVLEAGAVRLSGIQPGDTVLELGHVPGLGLEAASALLKGPTGRLMDYSQYMHQVAAERVKALVNSGKVRLLHCDVAAMPLADSSVDRVFHCNCYYFWPDLRKGAEEIHRVMKPATPSSSMQRKSRMSRELRLLSTEPPPGVTCWQTGQGEMDDLVLRAQIVGGADTPFEGGVFTLEIKVPVRYPFEPPKMRFLTPIYHPNIDTAGRICHDALKLPPKGAWRPSLSISALLCSIQLLMAEPNPDDPLMAEISAEFKDSKQLYLQTARRWTERHAVQNNQGVVETEKEGAQGRKREAVSGEKEEEGPKRACL